MIRVTECSQRTCNLKYDGYSYKISITHNIGSIARS
ncbi:hypothetical protein D5081_18895 [Pectobacterium carotovorum]|uniref:Uncharacterized protein n=1 Tax=Pectobacterium parvum TaxID=2778550 RepID=A0AAP9IGQ5_9GAMM|nr:hypothetical protein GMX10_11235 [Pectobacterium parvum]RJL35033.1 hypothetical protein D5081_18895 [Pectobacterium carotovorum]RJL37593.1 hypothetical protein D5083_18535 [Pectobacterium carotovorum]